ncbi:tyrosine-type recombinase/integrase [Sunxiuqinia sp. sy24]|uniref:tyrosine-type recombinase/integrase n=1 Tax=Sunxiuqinia sp. sy24 TaxID=3461495 RepID=UPI004045F4DD
MEKSSLPRITHPEQNFDTLKSKGVSLVAFLDTVRPRKDNTFTVRLQLVFDRIPKYYSTNINLSTDQYLKIAANGVRGDLLEKKRIIHQLLKKANDTICHMDEFSFELFKKHFLRRSTERNDILSSLEDLTDQLKKNNQLGTADVYRLTANLLKKYTKKQKLPFNQLTPDFLRNCENWMLEKEYSKTTISMYMRCIRKAFNDQIRTGSISSAAYPFGKDKYIIPAPRNIKKALTIQDIAKLFNYKPLKGTPEHYYRDLWLFLYLCNGINVKDLCLLKYSNIKGDTIEYDRAKTANTKRNSPPISIPILPEAQKIIKTWGNKPAKPSAYIFPVLSKGMNAEQQQKTTKQLIKQINKYIKRIAKLVGIQANVTTYVARHSYATILMRSGTSIAFISQALGHSNIATTENYLASFEKEQQKEIAKNLTKF